MFEILINNFKFISILMSMFLGSFICNTLLGLYNNISILKQCFSKERLVEGLIKGALIFISSVIIVTIISLLPEALTAFGFDFDTNILEDVSLIGMASVIISTIVKYLKDAIQKFYQILTDSNNEMEVKESE